MNTEESPGPVAPEQVTEEVSTNQNSHDVFLSYSHIDKEYAGQVRAALIKAGISTWMSARNIQTDEEWQSKIEENLRSSACVLVLWSRVSIKSKWVPFEAAFAQGRGAYVGCKIEKVTMPRQFDNKQVLDISGWDGTYNDDLTRLIQVISNDHLKRSQPSGFQLDRFDKEWQHVFWRPLLPALKIWANENKFLMLLLLGCLALLGWIYSELKSQVQQLKEQSLNNSALEKFVLEFPFKHDRPGRNQGIPDSNRPWRHGSF